ncbi:MAG: cysteine methyltransferase [Desulfuromonas sp.]|nr:MAG: cysteine methyltransferase [Desulfuromonas sp.]
MTTEKPLFHSIYSLVCQVPPGHVTTYGEVARHVGTTARTVGFAMAALPVGHDVPWQRVINSRGTISPRRDGDGSQIQRTLLDAEGVRFDAGGKIELKRFGWRFEP